MPEVDFGAGPVEAGSLHVPVMHLTNQNPFPVGAELRLAPMRDGVAVDPIVGSVVVPPNGEAAIGIQTEFTGPGQVSVDIGHRVAGPPPGEGGLCFMTNPVSMRNTGDQPVACRSVLTSIGSDGSATLITPYMEDSLAVGALPTDLGLRFDRREADRGSWTPASPVFPDLLPGTSAGSDAATWTNITPRVGLTYDLGDSALMNASYAMYADQLDTGGAPPAHSAYSYLYFEDPSGSDLDSLDMGTVYDPALTSPLVDPDLGSPLTNELTIGVEHAVHPEFITALSFRRRQSGWGPWSVRDGSGGTRPVRCSDWDPVPPRRDRRALIAAGAAILALLLLTVVLATRGGDAPVAATTATVAPTAATPVVTDATPAVTDATPAVTDATPAATEPTPAVTEPTAAAVELPTDPMDQAIITILRDAGFTDRQIARVFELGIPDALADWIYSISGVPPGDPSVEADIKRIFALAFGLEQPAATNLFGNTVFPCDLVDGERVVECASSGALPGGDVVLVAFEVDGAIPATPTDHTYTYAAVFADDDPSNDFEFFPPFDWDFYQGTDRWYELVGDPATGEWTLSVSVWTGDGVVPAPSTARAVLEHNTVMFWIPAAELSADPTFRVSAFRHDGTFGQDVSAGDVNGADPTGPLLEVEPTDFVLTGDAG